MKKLYFALLVATLGGTLAKAQTLYNKGGTIYINTDAKVYISGSLTNEASSTLSNNGTLEVTGNSVNNGILSSPTGSTISYAGTTALTLSGTQPFSAQNIIVNNPAGIILHTPLQVSGALKFTNGIIDASNSSYPLIFGSAATVNGVSDASHVKGYVVKEGIGAFTYPVGDGSKYQKVMVDASANATGIKVRYQAADAGTGTFATNGTEAALDSYNNLEYWDIIPNSTATAAITLFWDTYKDINAATLANRRVAHKTSGHWLNEGGTATGTSSAGSITSNVVSSFSPFAFGAVPSASQVSSIARASSDPTSATSVNFTVTFNSAVTGVDASDFTLSKTGSANGTIGTPTGSGKSWTVPVSSVSGDGTLRLDFTEIAGVIPNASEVYTSGQVYTIDNTKPNAPANFAATGKDSSVGLSWDANTDADITGYKIYWGESENEMNPPSRLLSSITATDLSYTHKELLNGTPYWYAIAAVDAAGNESLFSYQSAYAKGSQTIVFNALSPVKYGDADLELSAQSSAELPVSYTSDNNDVATVSGKTVTVKAVGTVKITATQAGNNTYFAAADVVQTLTVQPKQLTITAKEKIKTYGETASFEGTEFQTSGLINADAVSTVTLASSGSTSTAAANATGYDIEVSEATGTGLSNYEISYVKGKLKVGKKAISVTADPISKTYDGNATATILFDKLTSDHGLIGSDDLNVSYATATYNDKNAGSSKTITVNGIALAGSAKDNYTLNTFSSTGSIVKKSLTVTAKDHSKTYDAASYSGGNGVGYSGFAGTDDATAVNGTIIYSGTSQGAKDAGQYAITVSGLSSDNYKLNFIDGSLTILKKNLTVTAKNDSKTYNATPYSGGSGVEYTGFAASDDSTVLGGTVSYTGNSQGAVNAGSYTISPSGLTSDNYEFLYQKGFLTISKKALTVTAKDQTKTYDGITYSGGNGIEYSGFEGNDGVSAIGGTLTYTGTSQDAKNVGEYTLIPGGLTADNYELSYSAAKLTIERKALTISAENKSKTYGDVNPALTVTYSGLVNGETVLTPAPAVTTQATQLSEVGTYDITATGTATNYEVTFVKGTLTVDKKALTVTAENKSKVYGEANPALTLKYSGFVNNETGLSPAPVLATEATELSEVGSYDITATGTAANYALTFVKGTLSVSKKSLTVTAEDKSKTYGDTNPALSITYNGLVNGETALSPAPTVTTQATQVSGVGTYDIVASGTAANYDVTFLKGKLTIGKKALTVTAENKSKTYGDANPALTLTYNGLVNDETTLNPAPDVTTTATKLSGAGTYDINVTGTAANYELTFNKGTLTVDKKALSVTVNNKSKTYGDANPALTLTFNGLANGETALNPAPVVTTTATASTGVGIYDIDVTGTAANYDLTFSKGTLTVNKKALTLTVDNKSKTYGEANPVLTLAYTGLVNGETVLTPAPELTTPATELSGAGKYDIDVTGTSANYELTFNKGFLTVNKKALTITAEDKSKTYGEANPALTITYNGLVNGETVLNPAPAASTTATTASGVGTYDITASVTAANYDVTFLKGKLTIGKKALTVTADNKSKTYGDANPALTLSYNGLVNAETALNPAPTVSTAATILSGAGTYSIDVSGTAANYELTFNKGTLTVNKKALTVTADNKSKTYGDANPALTVTYNGLANGETALNPAPGVTTTATVQSGFGTYDITAGGTAANYDLTFVKGTLSVNKKAVTITAENKSKTYGDANPALAVTYNGLVNGETALNPAPVVTTTATALTGIGTYDITASGASANYATTYIKGTLTINKKALSITADNKEKFQGLALPTFTASYTGFANGETSAVLISQPTFATTANGMSPQGNYPITVSGATAANYTITQLPGVLTVKPGYPTSITLAASTLYENAAVNTVAGSLSSTSDDPSATFTYSLVNGTGDADNGSFKINGNQIQTNAVLNFENKANYNVLVRSTTQYGLSLDKALIITLNNVNEQPTLNNIADQTICYTTAQQIVALSGITAGEDTGQTTNLTVSSSNSNLFKSLTVSQASNGNAQVRYTAADGASGSAVVNVMVMDNGGTANSGVNTILKSFVLNVNALPVPVITTNKGITSISKGDELVLKAEGGTRYEWSNANGILSGQNSQNLTIRPDANTTYRVLVTNASGCTETKEISIEVKEDYIMAKGSNLISPNGDGVNDKFVIENVDMYPNNEVKIFDRAGRLLYAKKGYSKDGEWAGTLNGAPLAEDTYYYVVDFGPGKPKIKGFITIIKD